MHDIALLLPQKKFYFQVKTRLRDYCIKNATSVNYNFSSNTEESPLKHYFIRRLSAELE